MNIINKLKFMPEIIFLIVHMAFALLIIYNRNNPTIFDLAGHFASAKFFSQGYFHSYNDFQFLGMVQNLFYPPLQDMIITFISYFTFKNFIIAGFIYIGFVYLFYLSAFVYLASLIKNIFIRSTFLLIFSFWLLSFKIAKFEYLGLSLHDLMIIGLSTQFLGTAFLFILIKNLKSNGNYLIISLLLALSFLSHIISGLLSTVLVLGFSFHNKNYFYALILGVGLSALFWLPFAAHLSFVIKSTVYASLSVQLVSSAGICLLLYFFLKSRLPILLIISFLIFMANLYGTNFYNIHINGLDLPNFHYYRLVIYAYIFLFLEFFLFYEKIFLTNINKFVFIIILIVFFYYLKCHEIFLNKNNFLNLVVKNNFYLNNYSSYSRAYFVPNNDPGDQTLSSYLQVSLQNDFKISQGVYSEASKSNYLLSSYNSILFKERGGFIDSFWYNQPDCAINSCFFDQFVRDFNIGLFISDPTLQFNGMRNAQKFCLKKIIRERKTEKNILNYSGNIEDYFPEINKKRNRDVYSVSKIQATVFNNNSAIEIIKPTALVQTYKPDKPFYFNPYFQAVNKYCTFNKFNNNSEFNTLFFPKNLPVPSFNSDISIENLNLSKIKFEKVSRNKYRIFINTEKPVWFKIKLSWFPGFNLVDKNNNNLKIYPGIAYFISKGNGEMYLTFEKSFIFYFSYLISLTSFIILILLSLNLYTTKKRITMSCNKQ